MHQVRCKFRCNEKTQFLSNEKKPDGTWGPCLRYRFKFSAVCDDSPENKAFFDATPNGSLELATVKADIFEVGKEYFLDLVVA